MSYYAPTPAPGGPNYPSVTVATTNQPCSTAHIVIAWILTALTLGSLLPWAIAATRGHKDVVVIALINWLLGWTVIGWIVCLVWSLSSPGQQTTVIATQRVTYAYPPAQPPAPSWQPQPQPLPPSSADWAATRPLPGATTPWSTPSSDYQHTMPLPPQAQPDASPWQRPRG